MKILIIISLALSTLTAGQSRSNLSEFSSRFSVENVTGKIHGKFPIKGNIMDALSWRDSTGKNIIIFTRTDKYQSNIKTDSTDEWPISYFDADIYVYHYRTNDNDTVLVRMIHDFVKDCEFDLYIGFLDNSITITDLDRNNIAEVSFIYKYACRSDVSPSYMKLVMLEDGKKFILRGSMIINEIGDQKDIYTYGWGKYIIDSSFSKAPKAFLDHAISRWNIFKVEGPDDFMQL